MTYKNLNLLAAFILASSPLHAGLSDAQAKASLGLCNAFGLSSDVAKILALHPQVKETYKGTCCKIQSFRDANPNTVTKALDGCSGITADNNTSQEDFCKQVALAGGWLKQDGTLKKAIAQATTLANKIPKVTILGKTIDGAAAAKKVLAGLEKLASTAYKTALGLTGMTCCQYDAVMRANPKAAEIFGCPQLDEEEADLSAEEDELAESAADSEAAEAAMAA